MKNFSKYLGSALLCLSIIGEVNITYAQSNDNPGFIIDGKIEGVKDGTLVKLFDIDALKTVDSAYTEGGKFKIKGKVEKPTAFWIQCLNEYATIQVENVSMIFSSPLKDMKLNYIATGGKEQTLQTELNKLQRLAERIYTKAYDSLVNKTYTDSVHRIKLVKEFNNANNTYMNIYIDFGKQHIKSFLGLDIVYRNRKSIPKDSLLLLYNSLPVTLKKLEQANSLKLYLTENMLKKGDKFLDFEVKTITGEPFKLSSLKDKYIYLTFGSFACAPCRMENKEISENYNRLSKELHLVNFSLDINRKEWETAAKIDAIIWHNVSDMAGVAGAIKTLYDVQAMPTSFLINKNGIIVEKFVGYSTDNFKKIEEIIKQSK